MRYICPECGKFVKDKFILGLLHICENECFCDDGDKPHYHSKISEDLQTERDIPPKVRRF